MLADPIREAFYEALESIGVKDREERKIVFHSLRHWYNTQLRGSITDAVLRRFTRHCDAEMTEVNDAGKEIDFEKARARLDELTRPAEATKTGKIDGVVLALSCEIGCEPDSLPMRWATRRGCQMAFTCRIDIRTSVA
jgi:hypothetical protein